MLVFYDNGMFEILKMPLDLSDQVGPLSRSSQPNDSRPPPHKFWDRRHFYKCQRWFFSPRGRCSVHNCALRAGLRGPADNCLLSGFIGAAAAWPAAGTDHAHPDQHPCTCTSCTLATWWTNILAKTATLAPGCLPTSVATTQVAENQRCVMCWFHLSSFSLIRVPSCFFSAN